MGDCTYKRVALLWFLPGTSLFYITPLFLYLPRAVAKGTHVLARSSVKLHSPVTGPEKVICVGMNYVDHCTEQNMPVPETPVIFSKFASAIVDPDAVVELPPETQVSEHKVWIVI